MLQNPEDEPGVLGGEDLRDKGRNACVQKALEALGWRVITIWECELQSRQREATLQRLSTLLAPMLAQELRKTASYTNSYSDDDLLMVVEEEEEYASYYNK